MDKKQTKKEKCNSTFLNLKFVIKNEYLISKY